MSLYIMRHGQTDWNIDFKLQGQTDIPLNENGKKMAEMARMNNPINNIDICFCSPLVRAKETADIYLKNQNTLIEYDDRLKEFAFGVNEGTKKPFIPGSSLDILFKTPEKYIPDNGAESLESLYLRTGEFLEEKVYPLINSGKNILIVGHGAMNCAIIGRIKNTNIKNFWDNLTDNCVITKLL